MLVVGVLCVEQGVCEDFLFGCQWRRDGGRALEARMSSALSK